jgi:arylsulfatase
VLADPGEPDQRPECHEPAYFGVDANISVGRHASSPVSPDYRPPFTFTGGTIDRAVFDVSGHEYHDYEKEVLAYLMHD